MNKFAQLFIIGVFSLTFAGTVPSAVWNDKDMQASTVFVNNAIDTILIASRTSDFKNTLVKTLTDSLTKRSYAVVISGISTITDSTDLSHYGAVVLINTCVAWNWENKVSHIIKTRPAYNGFVVLTTAGDAKWKIKPKKIPAGVDAISSASTKDKQDADVQFILNSITKKLSPTQ